jgi:hypothetical protein
LAESRIALRTYLDHLAVERGLAANDESEAPFASRVELDFDARNFGAGVVGGQLADIGASEKRHVWQFEDRADAIVVCVRLGLNQAGKTIARIAADTLTLPAHLFV